MAYLLRSLLVACAALLLQSPGLAAAPPRPELLHDLTFRETARDVLGTPPEVAGGDVRSAARSAARITPTGKNVRTVGTVRPLVLLVDFPDRRHNPEGHDPADYAWTFFANPDNSATPPNTVAEYFAEVSYGALTVDGDAGSIAVWQELPAELANYLDASQGIGLSPVLAADAVAAHDPGVDFSLFDNDGPDGVADSGDDDGYVDLLLILHAGYGWEDSGDPGDLASHYRTATIETADLGAAGTPIRVADFVVVPEESYKLDLVQNGLSGELDELEPHDDGDEPIAEIGVYCHEIGHLLGLPDLYDTTLETLGIGNWGLMGYGLWGMDYDGGIRPETSRTHNQPAHPGAWSKQALGWLTPSPIWTANTGVLLEPAEVGARARVLYADSEASEYFLLEHRRPTGYDTGFATGGGLLIWHVNETALAAGGAAPNNGRGDKGVDVECANGLDAAGLDDLDAGAAFLSLEHLFYRGRAFDPSSSPDSSTDGGGSTGISVGQLNGPTSGTQNLSGLASAGTVVLNPRDVVVRPSDGALRVDWTPLPPGSDTRGYRLYAAPVGAPAILLAELVDPAASTYTLTGLANGETQTLRLTAHDSEFDFATGDWNESDGVVTFGAPQLDTAPPAIAASPPGGVYGRAVTAVLIPSDGVDPAPDVAFTTGDGPPSTPYAGPLLIDADTTLRFEATDASGNTSGVATEVYVIDRTAPTLTVLGDNPLTHEAGTPYADPGATAVDAVAGDLTAAVAVVDPVQPGTPGAYAVTYSVRDDVGNEAVAARTVRVVDTVAPQLTAPPDMVREASAPLTAVEIGSAAASDAVGVASLTHDAPGDGFPVGTTAVTWTATDTSENQATALQQVTVTDTTPPVLTLVGPNPLTVEAGGNYTEPGATAADLVDGDLTPLVEIEGDLVDPARLGTYTVTYDVADGRGNAAATATRTVRVADTVAPTITLLGADPLRVEAGTSYSDPGATAHDAFEGDLSAEIVMGGDPVDPQALGTYRVTYDVADSSGNSAPQEVRTVEVADTTPPVITLLGADTVTLTAGQPYAEPGFMAADEFEGDLTAQVSVDDDAVQQGVPGSYTVTYTVHDASGNTADPKSRTVIRMAPTTSSGNGRGGGGGGICFIGVLR